MRAGSRRYDGRGACMFRNSRRFCLSLARKGAVIPAARQARCMGYEAMGAQSKARSDRGITTPKQPPLRNNFTDALG